MLCVEIRGGINFILVCRRSVHVKDRELERSPIAKPSYAYAYAYAYANANATLTFPLDLHHFTISCPAFLTLDSLCVPFAFVFDVDVVAND
jgi:hypothetical protein